MKKLHFALYAKCIKWIAAGCIIMGATAHVSAQTKMGPDIDGTNDDGESGSAVSVSSDGLRVAIGAPKADPYGEVRIWDFNGTTWVPVGSPIFGTLNDGLFGFSVSLSDDGNTVAIGMPGKFGNTFTEGIVRVYVWTGFTWAQKGLDITGENIGDQAGIVSLSADGDRVAIGAPSNDDAGLLAGQVRVYNFSMGMWSQVGSDIDGDAADDRFGGSVSLSDGGTRVACGAPSNDDNGLDAGHVKVLDDIGGSWVMSAPAIEGESANDLSGASVSFSEDGNTLAIGAIQNYGMGGMMVNSGHVRVYEYDAGIWIQKGADIDGEFPDDRSGISVSLSGDGNRVAIGSPQNGNSFPDAGHVRVFQYYGGTWFNMTPGGIKGEAMGDFSGYLHATSLSEDGCIVGIGAPYNDTGIPYSFRGHTRVYNLCKTKTSFAQPSEIADARLEIFPNPSDGAELLKMEARMNLESSATIQILDISGRTIATLFEGMPQSETFTMDVDVRSWESGIYLLRVVQDGAITTKKFVKN